MKWTILICFFLFWGCQGTQENVPDKIVFSEGTVSSDAGTLDKALEYEGTKIHHYEWVDANGKQTVIFSRVSNADSVTDTDQRKATFFITWFTQSNDLLTKTAVFSDGVDSCQCDCQVQLIDQLTQVKDIDKDGNGDLFFMYELQDNCDASPVTAKACVLSGDKKLESSGRTRLYLDDTEGQKLIRQYQLKQMDGYQVPFTFGQMDGPESWREYAGHVWQQYVTQEAQQYYDQQR